MKSPWTQDMADEAKALYLEVGLSAAGVAQALNVKYALTFSRSAVMAKLDRMGCIGTVKSGDHRKAAALLPHRSPTVVRSVQPRRITPASDARSSASGLEPLGPANQFTPHGTCQFMTGSTSDPEWHMCGRPGYPWCDDHKAVVFQKVTDPQQV